MKFIIKLRGIGAAAYDGRSARAFVLAIALMAPALTFADFCKTPPAEAEQFCLAYNEILKGRHCLGPDSPTHKSPSSPRSMGIDSKDVCQFLIKFGKSEGTCSSGFDPQQQLTCESISVGFMTKLGGNKDPNVCNSKFPHAPESEVGCQFGAYMYESQSGFHFFNKVKTINDSPDSSCDPSVSAASGTQALSQEAQSEIHTGLQVSRTFLSDLNRKDQRQQPSAPLIIDAESLALAESLIGTASPSSHFSTEDKHKVAEMVARHVMPRLKEAKKINRSELTLVSTVLAQEELNSLPEHITNILPAEIAIPPGSSHFILNQNKFFPFNIGSKRMWRRSLILNPQLKVTDSDRMCSTETYSVTEAEKLTYLQNELAINRAILSRGPTRITGIDEVHQANIFDPESGFFKEYKIVLCQSYHAGGDLIHALPNLTEGQIVDGQIDLLSQLGELSQLDIAHRDIKPANVVVDRRGRFRLTDFNSAGRGKKLRLTGTPKFLAPELLRVDHKKELPIAEIEAGDAWSSALTLYFLETGKNGCDEQGRNAGAFYYVLGNVSNYEELCTACKVLCETIPDPPTNKKEARLQVIREMLHPDAKKRLTIRDAQFRLQEIKSSPSYEALTSYSGPTHPISSKIVEQLKLQIGSLTALPSIYDTVQKYLSQQVLPRVEDALRDAANSSKPVVLDFRSSQKFLPEALTKLLPKSAVIPPDGSDALLNFEKIQIGSGKNRQWHFALALPRNSSPTKEPRPGKTKKNRPPTIDVYELASNKNLERMVGVYAFHDLDSKKKLVRERARAALKQIRREVAISKSLADVPISHIKYHYESVYGAKAVETFSYQKHQEKGTLTQAVGSITENQRTRGSLSLVDQATKIHLKKIAHRDLKPDNIFIDSEGNYHIGDTGDSWREEDYEHHRYSLSPKFAAPELLQVRNDLTDAHSIEIPKNLEKTDLSFEETQGTDVWSLGMVLLFNEQLLSEDGQRIIDGCNKASNVKALLSDLAKMASYEDLCKYCGICKSLVTNPQFDPFKQERLEIILQMINPNSKERPTMDKAQSLIHEVYQKYSSPQLQTSNAQKQSDPASSKKTIRRRPNAWIAPNGATN